MNATRLRKRSHATAAVKRVISLASANPQAVAGTLAVDIVAEEAVKSATSAAKWATLHATAPRVADTAVVDTEGVTEPMEAAVAEGARPVTLAEVTGTCRATAHKGKNATTVSDFDRYVESDRADRNSRRRSRTLVP